MRQRVSMGVFAAASLLVATAGHVGAQELARRVSAVGTGRARFSNPARADVEICDRGVLFGGGRIQWRGRIRDEARRCVTRNASAERTARESETRQAATFWLAQSDDSRMLAFFDEILLGR